MNIEIASNRTLSYTIYIAKVQCSIKEEKIGLVSTRSVWSHSTGGIYLLFILDHVSFPFSFFPAVFVAMYTFLCVLHERMNIGWAFLFTTLSLALDRISLPQTGGEIERKERPDRETSTFFQESKRKRG